MEFPPRDNVNPTETHREQAEGGIEGAAVSVDERDVLPLAVLRAAGSPPVADVRLKDRTGQASRHENVRAGRG